MLFHIREEHRESAMESRVAIANSGLDHATVKRIAITMCRQAQGLRPLTQRSRVATFLKPLIAFVASKSAGSPYRMPTDSDEWQIFLLEFLRFYLIDTSYSKCAASTRFSNWQLLVVVMLEFWMEEEIIPFDVVIPKINIKSNPDSAPSHKLLSQPKSELRSTTSFSQKIITNVDFSKNDADYLSAIEETCRRKINIIIETCKSHWDAVTRDFETG
ncbi:hypothetical protein SAMN05446635_8431 [Burkholderia sp. OK233]|nr:hypothetical protein SAMN05446635_8431 [Burkholderia sp. OK233]